MISKSRILLLFFCVVSFCSCVTNKHTDFLQNIPKDYPTVEPAEYRVIPGDQLSITIYAVDEKISRQFQGYTPTYTSAGNIEQTSISTWESRRLDNTMSRKPIDIYADGTINFPYLGKIYVQGLTLYEIKKLLSDKLEAYAEGTTADVAMANRYFSVLGETGAQRLLLQGTSMNIYQALATANTIGTYGNRSKVSIIRQTADGTVLLKEFDLRSKDIIDSEYYYIQPNDVIYFPQMKRKFFGGTDSFGGTLSLVTLFTGIIVYAARLF